MPHRIKSGSNGVLLVEGITYPVLFISTDYGIRMKMRPLSGSVLGRYLERESGIAAQNPYLIDQLKRGNAVTI